MKTKLKDARVEFPYGFIEIKDGTMNIRYDGEYFEFLSELFTMMKNWNDEENDDEWSFSALVQIWEEKGANWPAILQYCRDELKDTQCLEEIAHRISMTSSCHVSVLKKQHRQSCMKNPCLYFKTRHHVSVSKRVAKDIVTEAHENVTYDLSDFVGEYGRKLKKELASKIFGSVDQLHDPDLRGLKDELAGEWRRYVNGVNDEAIRRVVKQKSNPEPPNGGHAAEEHGIREAKI